MSTWSQLEQLSRENAMAHHIVTIDRLQNGVGREQLLLVAVIELIKTTQRLHDYAAELTANASVRYIVVDKP